MEIARERALSEALREGLPRADSFWAKARYALASPLRGRRHRTKRVRIPGARTECDSPEWPNASKAALRVVRIIARLNVGGPALHVRNASVYMAPQISTIVVAGATDSSEADLAPELRRDGVVIMTVPPLGRHIGPLRDVQAFARIVRILRRLRPDVVHTHTAKAGAVGRLAAAFVRVPVRVHTFHGHVFSGYFRPVTAWVFIVIERLLARLTHAVVTVSESQARELADVYRICPRSRIHVVPLGLDLERFRVGDVELRAEFRGEVQAGTSYVVTTVGRLTPVKNHALFLDAARLLLADGVDAIFVVVGDGSERNRLEELVRCAGLTGHVRFLGWRRDLERIYAASDAVVLTSLNEGTPVSIIEALAAGCEVVSTNVGGVPDVLENGALGRLVPSNNASALAAALCEALESPASPQRREWRARRTKKRYATARLASDLARLYAQLYADRGGSSLARVVCDSEPVTDASLGVEIKVRSQEKWSRPDVIGSPTSADNPVRLLT